MLVARDDPLDTYLVHHPEALLGAAGRGDVLDPDQPLRARPAPVLRRRRAAADRGRPARCSRPGAREAVLAELVAGRAAAPRPARLVLDRTGARPATWPTSAGPGGAPVQRGRGRHRPGARHRRRRRRARARVHTGAVYLHQGETYLVDELDLDDARRRWCTPTTPDWTHLRPATSPTSRVVAERRARGRWGRCGLSFGDGRRHHTRWSPTCSAGCRPARCSASEPLDLPARHAAHPRGLVDGPDRALLERPGVGGADLPGAAARRRARRDRAAAAVRDLRPLGHRRRLDRPAPGHRAAHRLRLRRPPRRRRLRRAGLRAAPRLADRHPRRRSPPASAEPAARRACSRPSAATATTRSTRPARSRVLDVVLGHVGRITSRRLRSLMLRPPPVGPSGAEPAGGGRGAVEPVGGGRPGDAPTPPQTGERHRGRRSGVSRTVEQVPVGPVTAHQASDGRRSARWRR